MQFVNTAVFLWQTVTALCLAFFSFSTWILSCRNPTQEVYGPQENKSSFWNPAASSGCLQTQRYSCNRMCSQMKLLCCILTCLWHPDNCSIWICLSSLWWGWNILSGLLTWTEDIWILDPGWWILFTVWLGVPGIQWKPLVIFIWKMTHSVAESNKVQLRWAVCMHAGPFNM